MKIATLSTRANCSNGNSEARVTNLRVREFNSARISDKGDAIFFPLEAIYVVIASLAPGFC